MLSNSSEYLLSPDIVVCPCIEDLYLEIERNTKEEKSLYVYVDSLFINISILAQLEMFSYEFKDFRIIIDKTQSLIVDINPTLKRDCYYVTNVGEIATEIFIKMEKYEKEYEILSKMEDLK
jgi:hypothetical protein